MNHKILFLHGGGTGNKHRIDYLRDPLTKHGIELYSFNFTGHSGNENEMKNSSLEKRLKEACQAVEKFNLKEPLHLIGSSMGGYIALKMTQLYNVASLILTCPGLYDTRAFTVPFGPEFTTILREKDSWKQSDAFPILHTFRGKILIIIGTKDTIIPKELVPFMEQNLDNAKFKETLYVPDAPHHIHTWLAEHELWKATIVDKISKLF